MRRAALFLLVCVCLLAGPARADTWPQWKAEHGFHLKPLVLPADVLPEQAQILVREWNQRLHHGRALRWKAWLRANPPVTTPSVSSPPVYGPYEAGVVAIIHDVFGPYGDEGVAVGTCESGLRTTAKNGQFWGIFQMGEYARGKYGYGDDAFTQVTTAYAYFADTGFDWSPWSCKP